MTSESNSNFGGEREEEQCEIIVEDKNEKKGISDNSFNNIRNQPFNGENMNTQYRQAPFVLLKTTSTPSRTPNLSNAWEFAGWGSTYYIDLPTIEPSKDDHLQTESRLLGQWRATSISGNDLTASVLYTIGLCIVVAGKFAPISLFIVTIILYPFKAILSEVSTALPLNGGSYNCILNTSSKWFASVAAAFSLLDYMSTAVVSAATATSYVSGNLHLSIFLVFVLTIGILIISASVVASGIKESSNVAFVIFILHCITLSLLIIASVVRWIIQGNDILIENWKDPGSGNPLLDIFNGVCVGLLGVTGFETSSNYIEDQKPDVYPKTVRNMWILVSIFNAPISFLALTIIPLSTIKEHQNDAISTIGKYAAGNWLEIFIVIDAVIVLCGGVLSGFVGATGLIQRMTSDHILPQFLLRKNRFTGTYHWIILSFLIFCITLYVIVGGDTTSLAGVFAISFLSVLCMFAIGNILLKYKRGRLYRKVRVSTGVVFLGLASILAGLIGNIVYNPQMAHYFLIYFGSLFFVMLLMLNRVWLLKTLFFYLDKIIILHKFKVADTVISLIKKLKEQPVIFFTNTDELHILNKAILYVKDSESSGHIKFVHLYEKIEDIPKKLEASHVVLDELYPKIQIDLMFIQGKFDPETVEAISIHLKIPKSLMFISCPGEKFRYKIGEFGGIRTIML
ncbi:hypothetical protein Glove_11g36 [Diversispora epigaea]|uniref:Amino acid permease/ SLC12A domain-containing protein n=1 Tax=Diversispora epigaea TaxID=1348612 RepID=A0A397JXX6_9GLOM|nr:hypothetical protein Glove_11g36 [Diversispora epigaea]